MSEAYIFIQPVCKISAVLSTVGSVMNKALKEFKVSCETLPRLNQLPGYGSCTVIQILEQTVAYKDALTTFGCSYIFIIFFIYNILTNPGSNSFQSFIFSKDKSTWNRTQWADGNTQRGFFSNLISALKLVSWN